MVNRDDLPLLFATARHRAWIAAIEKRIKGGSEVLPALDPHQCHVGRWLDGKGQARYGGHPAFQAIEPLHRQAHALVAELLSLHDAGRNPEARARLGEVHATADALIEQFKMLCRDVSEKTPVPGIRRPRYEPSP